ncbi:hypothetical protein VitviT2T_016456 [Vitis vinifera]|uniref:rRNA methyltransferase 1, mitochondrial n=2 Tax=Vitis vinifera TaxID=29760 RepID=A0ABY9CTL1_VITVI|nr:uncharacterized protein LOC100242436 [Vitis vinifera]WJZ97886.1 hypothetical protein VitviT2T_016456 [Vitis vinifera]|eukprot:XP_002280407.1 PREDICTED: uncharacterized protein LOC100242436 [Vitis vinifera]
MYCNFTKCQAFPLAIRVSSQPICFRKFHTLKTQFLPIGFHPKPSQNPILVKCATLSCGFGCKPHENSHSLKSTGILIELHHKALEKGTTRRPRSVSCGFRLKNVVQSYNFLRGRSFSSSYSVRVVGGSGAMRTGKALPWLTAKGAKERKSSDKVVNLKNNQSYWEKSAKRSEKVTTAETSRSSWEESAERFGKNHSSRELLPKNGTLRAGTEGSKNIMVDMVESQKNGYMERDESAEEEMEVIDDPRWDKIKNRYTETGDVKGRYERPELRRWNKQENWGRKTWKEATESTIPKIVGEGIYGVGPVLAALSAGRREFYALYVQEGLDLSGNNRKKKDKKGFEKVLKLAEKIGLSIKDLSKHDLNMVVDNRPHQGLVLDASPLEMVKIKELDPVLTEGEKGPLWVALDEVTDPQNLGAIIRSAYFFGVSGVVLCAKNSAPLSGVVSKASAGSLELMELRFCKNMMQFLTSSAENGWQVLGGSVSPRAIPLNEISPGAPTILVLGSEGTGLRPLVERSCTQLIRIPGNIPVHVTAGEVEDVDTSEMDRRCLTEDFQSFLAVESLNVSVAAGVLLHHLVGNSYENNCLLGDKQVDALQ